MAVTKGTKEPFPYNEVAPCGLPFRIMTSTLLYYYLLFNSTGALSLIFTFLGSHSKESFDLGSCFHNNTYHLGSVYGYRIPEDNNSASFWHMSGCFSSTPQVTYAPYILCIYLNEAARHSAS